jgi:hypothetical protein
LHYGTRVHDFKLGIEEGDERENSIFLGGDSISHNSEIVHIYRCVFVNSCEVELFESTVTKPQLVATQKAILLILVLI